MLSKRHTAGSAERALRGIIHNATVRLVSPKKKRRRAQRSSMSGRRFHDSLRKTAAASARPWTLSVGSEVRLLPTANVEVRETLAEIMDRANARSARKR